MAAKDGDTKSDEKESAVIRVSLAISFERLLNLVGELVISRGRLEQRLMALEQLSDQVIMFKGRMLEAVRTFEEKHAFTLPSASPNQGTVTRAATQAAAYRIARLDGLRCSLDFDWDHDSKDQRTIWRASADVGESMAQLNGSIRKACVGRQFTTVPSRSACGMKIAPCRMPIRHALRAPAGGPRDGPVYGKQVSLSHVWENIPKSIRMWWSGWSIRLSISFITGIEFPEMAGVSRRKPAMVLFYTRRFTSRQCRRAVVAASISPRSRPKA